MAPLEFLAVSVFCRQCSRQCEDFGGAGSAQGQLSADQVPRLVWRVEPPVAQLGPFAGAGDLVMVAPLVSV